MWEPFGRGAHLAWLREGSRARLSHVMASILMASILDPASPEIRSATDSARASLVRLRALAFLDLLDAAASRSAERQGTKAAAAS